MFCSEHLLRVRVRVGVRVRDKVRVKDGVTVRAHC